MTSTCQEKTNVAFLKVHKAGSSTVLNILQRFGEKRQLTFALPKSGNYLGWGKTIQEEALLKPPRGKSYNVLMHHVVYNRQAFRKIMPNDTVYIAIVREPLELLDSAIRYLQHRASFKYLSDIPEDKVESFLSSPTKYETPAKVADSFTNNRMAFDFGLAEEHLHDAKFARDYIETLKEDFSLVLVLEYLDESLVLLKRMLCWKTEDILYMPANVNLNRKRKYFSQEVRQNHQDWSIADNLVYDAFYKQFWNQLLQLNVDFFEEVKVFKHILQYVHEFCAHVDDNSAPYLLVNKTNFNEAFKIDLEDCRLLSISELDFLELSRKRHRRNLIDV